DSGDHSVKLDRTIGIKYLCTQKRRNSIDLRIALEIGDNSICILDVEQHLLRFRMTDDDKRTRMLKIFSGNGFRVIRFDIVIDMNIRRRRKHRIGKKLIHSLHKTDHDNEHRNAESDAEHGDERLALSREKVSPG